MYGASGAEWHAGAPKRNACAADESQVLGRVITHMLSVAEMETVAVWAACLRFCLFDRHPRRTSWLTELMMDK